MVSRSAHFLHSGNESYVYVWTCRQFQEQVEWDDVNKLLQHQGFKPVFFADPVENKNLSDLVLLDKKSAGEVRTTLRTMLTDSDRRQALIQELAKSNNQLKEEAQKHMNRAAQQSQRITELEALLDQVTTRVQDLEDRYLGKAVQQHSYTQQLQQGQAEAEKRCQLLELKLRKKEEEAAQIQRKLHFALREEEQRLARQSQTFHNICRKLFQPRCAADQQVMDVIDYYETKLSHLLEELRSARGEADGSKKTSTSVTPSFTTILQEQQKEASRQVEELKRDVDRLKQELDTRPTLKEVKFYKHKLRRLEGLNRSMNTRHGTYEMNERTSDESSGCRLCDQYHHLLTGIAAVVTDPNAPLRLCRLNASSQRSDPADFQVLLPILEERAQQLHLLKDLQHSINKLTVKLLPWQPHKGDVADGVKVEDMMVLVDAMLENSSADDEQKLRSPTRYTLASMVSHFQKLFDIRSLSGVFPRMNEVYTRLGEMTNAMRNLRDVLNLDNRVPAAEVVNHVARLVSSNTSAAALQDLQGEADINSIIVKVKQHDEFFPAFHALVTEMLLVLGVAHLDDVLPAVKSLKEKQ
ncbi:centrosomal protein of 70 kDa isoform X2 [Melanotaenia boesemani]|uniref:centrosomal protein of 70 kDa isoform X2 n=1 Tax=Melanotaenia boesemani TaxID=1250792 RepID=UPI001C05CEFF|nr:centrosomal protein of 70 kDa isoform X2 [Melanotaenia boesemani]